nr:DUF2992 family protein [Yeguia hominis]
MQQQIQYQLHSTQVGTKAQQALKLQHEAGKERRRRRTKTERETERDRQFALRQERRKEKHRGH